MGIFKWKLSKSDEIKTTTSNIPPADDSVSSDSGPSESAIAVSVNPEPAVNADKALPGSPPAEPDDSGSVDSVIKVRIIENGLQACLYIEPPVKNGAGPTVDSMMAALSGAGVTYNIDMEKLRELEAKPVFYKDVVVAAGGRA